MSTESLSKEEIETLLKATYQKDEKRIGEKIETDPFSILNNDFWMREASVESLENLKLNSISSLSKKMSDKLSASEKNLFKEILSSIFSKVVISKDISELKLNKKIEIEVVPAKKIRKQNKPGTQCFYGNFSGRINGIYSILLTNETTINIFNEYNLEVETQRQKEIKNINEWLHSVVTLFTESLSEKIGEVKTSEIYQVMAMKSDQLILPEGSYYYKVKLEMLTKGNAFGFDFLFSVYNAKNILNYILQLNPNIKRNIKNHHRVVRSVETKLNKFMKDRETYLSENEIREVSKFIKNMLSKDEKNFLLTSNYEKSDFKDEETGLIKTVISLSNEIIDSRYKIKEVEMERKEKIISLIGSIPFPLFLRFEDISFDYETFKNLSNSDLNIEKFIGQKGELIFANRIIQEVILKKENEKLIICDLTENLVSNKYDLRLTNLEILNLEFEAEIEIGRASLHLDKLINILPGDIIELDNKINEPVYVVIENVIFAEVTIVVMNEKFGVWIEDIANKNYSKNMNFAKIKMESNLEQNKIPMSNLRVILGKIKLSFKDLLNFNKGSIIEMEKSMFEPAQIIIGQDLSFVGEIIELDSGNFGVRFGNNINNSQEIFGDEPSLKATQFSSIVGIEKNEEEENYSNPFEFLEDQEINSIYDLIKNESAQMIGMILLFMTPEKSGKILQLIDEKKQSDVIAKIAIGDRANLVAAKEIAKALKFTFLSYKKNNNLHGIEMMNRILESTDSVSRKKMMDALEKKLPDIFSILESE